MTYYITVDLPPGVSSEEMRLYIKDAVQTWCKQGSIEDDDLPAIFNLKASSVKVRKIGKKKGKARGKA